MKIIKCLSVLLLLPVTLWAENRVFTGEARSLSDGRLLYRETHTLQLDSDRPISGVVEYHDAEGVLIARKTNQYHERLATTDFVLMDMRNDYREQAQQTEEAEHAQHHQGYIERYLRTGDAGVMGKGREVIGRRKSGETFLLHLTVSEMMLDGDRTFTAIVHDLSKTISAPAAQRRVADARSCVPRTPRPIAPAFRAQPVASTQS